MPHLDHVAIWVADLDSARDFYSHWFKCGMAFQMPANGFSG